MISNIKISLIYETSEKWKKDIIQKCEEMNIKYKQNGNMIIIKSDFVLCIIEKKLKPGLRTQSGRQIHVNLSGVKNFNDLKLKLDFLKNIFLKKKYELKYQKVDNISANFSLANKINLRDLYEKTQNCKYNTERFPGLFLKLENSTAVIFNSGKVNILGCKTESQVLQAWNKVKEIVNVYTPKQEI